jgi:hypothetical protein
VEDEEADNSEGKDGVSASSAGWGEPQRRVMREMREVRPQEPKCSCRGLLCAPLAIPGLKWGLGVEGPEEGLGSVEEAGWQHSSVPVHPGGGREVWELCRTNVGRHIC